jgi:hypothetical protein
MSRKYAMYFLLCIAFILIFLKVLYLYLAPINHFEINNSLQCFDKPLLERKRRHHCDSVIREKEISSQIKVTQHPGIFWTAFWEPTFSCAVEEKVGVKSARGWYDGAKWVCDVHSISPSECLVYSFESLGNYQFERGLRERIGGCTVHVFDPFTLGSPPSDTSIHVHPWGLAPHSYNHRIEGSNQYITMKSLADIISSLGHTNRHIDILKVDIEVCAVTPTIDMKYDQFIGL